MQCNSPSAPSIIFSQSHSASYCRWSPDGSKILTAVCTPFIKVDNDYKIFDLAGNLVYHAKLKHTSVFDVQWRPGFLIYSSLC